MRIPDEEITQNVFSLSIEIGKKRDKQWALDSVHCSSFSGEVVLELCFPEFSLFIPASSVQELSQATIKGLQALRLSAARTTIISDSLDAHISVEGLVKDFLKERSIGIMPHDQIRSRSLAIASGEMSAKPGDPKFWFESLKSFSNALRAGRFAHVLGGMQNPT